MTLAPLIEGFEHRNTVGGITETRKRTTWVKKKDWYVCVQVKVHLCNEGKLVKTFVQLFS